MELRARFRPHQRGFGFLTPLADDGRSPASIEGADANGDPRRLSSVFVPPPLARGLLADDVVLAVVDVSEERPACTEVSLERRGRRLAAGVLERRRGALVVLADRSVAPAPIALADPLAERLASAVGETVVVLLDAGEATPRGTALIAGPYPAGGAEAVRAGAVGAVLGGAAPSLAASGAASVGLEPAAAETAHLRVAGQLAAGSATVAEGLERRGPVPGADLAAVDRRDEPCVTVDGFGSRDLDDAVSASWSGVAQDPVRVAVHVTDVAGDVGIDSAADRHARTMGATVYLGGVSAPMLGEDLAAAAGSLGAGQERRVLSARFDVAADGEVTNVEVEPARIRSRARLSYSAVEAWLDGDGTQLRAQARTQGDAAAAVLRAAAEASRRLAGARQRRVSLASLFEPAELTPAVVDGELVAVPAEPHPRAHELIEQLMVAANEAVGLWLAERGVPALYRVHAGLDAEQHRRLAAALRRAGLARPDRGQGAEGLTTALLDGLARLAVADAARAGGAPPGGGEAPSGSAEPGSGEVDAPDRDADDLAAARALLVTAAASASARARYASTPGAHRGLAAAVYCHFTSPLRRYADLVVHRQVRAMLAGEQLAYDRDALDALGGWLDARTGPLGRLEAVERNERWVLLLVRGAIAGAEPAVVTDVRASGVRVRLPRLGLTGFLPAGLLDEADGQLAVVDHGLASADGRWSVGGRLKVRYAGVDEQGRVDWQPVPAA